MTTLNINLKDRTIEMTKAFATAAGRFGTEEYRILQEARRDYPNYRVTVKKSKKSSDSLKGLNYKYIKNYIVAHPKTLDDGMTTLEALTILRGVDSEGNRIPGLDYASYGEIKAWFLEQYPEIKNQRDQHRKNINSILGKKVA